MVCESLILYTLCFDCGSAYLDSVGVAGLTQNLQQRRIRHKEESGEQQPLLLQVARQRLLADLQLLQQMRQQLTQRVVAHAAQNHVGVLVRALHDLHPRLVDVGESLGLLRELLGDVAAHEDGLQVNPEVLHDEPVLDDLGGAR